MIFGQDRQELRSMYATAWKKYCDNGKLTSLEAQIAQVISDHPEYHDAITSDLDRDFSVAGGKTNPFLHMGLHLGIREQVATNRPAGIASVFNTLAAASPDPPRLEHRMIDGLAETLWEAQSQNQPPNEALYLERLKRL